MKKQLIFSSLVVFSVMLISACGKKKQTAIDASETNDVAEKMYSDVFNEISKTNSEVEDGQFKTSIFKNTGTSGAFASEIPECATVTYTLSNNETFIFDPDTNHHHADSLYLKSVTIDYGTDGCEQNGRTRKGKIEIIRDGKWFEQGTQTTATLVDFSIDGYAIEGNKTITTKEVSLQFVTPFITASFDVDVAGGKITHPDGSTIIVDQWESTRNGTWTLETGFAVFFKLTGSASGVDGGGNVITVTILEQLIAKLGCKWIIDGSFEIVTPDLTVELDYGDGTCDNKATYSINGKKEKELEL